MYVNTSICGNKQIFVSCTPKFMQKVGYYSIHPLCEQLSLKMAVFLEWRQRFKQPFIDLSVTSSTSIEWCVLGWLNVLPYTLTLSVCITSFSLYYVPFLCSLAVALASAFVIYVAWLHRECSGSSWVLSQSACICLCQCEYMHIICVYVWLDCTC